MIVILIFRYNKVICVWISNYFIILYYKLNIFLNIINIKNKLLLICKFEIDESGFVFYVTFYPRNSNYNIDQLKVGRATEINYREAIFPLSFFAKLTDKDISISFTFYNYNIIIFISYF